MRWGLKARLTFWHGAAVALILAIAFLAAERVLARMLDAQIDAALLALAETEAASALDDPEGRVHLHAVPPDGAAPPFARLDKLVQIIDAEGRVLDRSAILGEATLPAPPSLLVRLRRGEPVIETLPDFGGVPVRLVSLPIEVEGRAGYAIQVGASLRPVQAFLRAARLLLAATSAAILAAVVLTGGLVARSALRPIDRIVAMARGIGEANLSQRLPHPGTADEIGRLTTTLNEMLDRIERSVAAQRRFTADASHELRSPLSRLRAELEVALRRPRSAAEYEAVLRSGLEEVERLSRLCGALLTLARLDAGERPVRVEAAALTPVVREALERLEAEAARRGVRVILEPSPTVTVPVAADLLALVVGNLLDNAVKFSPPGSEVRLRVSVGGAEVRFAVADSGPGIPAEEVPRLFERFYRGDASRSPDTPGVGLGLAIAHAIVRAHGGRITVASRPGAGATFTVHLPLAA